MTRYTINADVDVTLKAMREGANPWQRGLPYPLLKQLTEAAMAGEYAGILKASQRWTHPVQNWSLTLSQLAIHFKGCLDGHIDL